MARWHNPFLLSAGSPLPRCGLRAILFDRENPRHVCTGNGLRRKALIFGLAFHLTFLLHPLKIWDKIIKKQGILVMASNPQEFNGNLFDQLTLIERIRRAIKRGGVEEAENTMQEIETEINRKLYQKPPLYGDTDL